MDGSSLNLHICTEMAAIDANEWDALAGKKNPFISHAFLAALEAGGAVDRNGGSKAPVGRSDAQGSKFQHDPTDIGTPS